MKYHLTVSIDGELVALAKQRYENVSATVERLLRADLESPEKIKETTEKKRELQLKTEISVHSANVSQLKTELNKIDAKRAAAKKKEEDYFKRGTWVGASHRG